MSEPDKDPRIEFAERLLNDPLNVQFFEQTKEAIYSALEGVNEQDVKALQSLASMAKWRSKFYRFYKSFLETGRIAEVQEKRGVIDSAQRFFKRNK